MDSRACSRWPARWCRESSIASRRIRSAEASSPRSRVETRTLFEAAGLDEKAAQLGWSDDQLWVVKRMANSHDIFHVVSGYDRSIIGEVGVDAYTAGHMPMLPLRLRLERNLQGG